MGKSKLGKRIVVKVQQSLNGSTGKDTMVLIYDESRKFEYQGVLPKGLKKIMEGRPKIYCNATLMPDLDSEGKPLGTFKFALENEVEEVPKW